MNFGVDVGVLNFVAVAAAAAAFVDVDFPVVVVVVVIVAAVVLVAVVVAFGAVIPVDVVVVDAAIPVGGAIPVDVDVPVVVAAADAIVWCDDGDGDDGVDAAAHILTVLFLIAIVLQHVLVQQVQMIYFVVLLNVSLMYSRQ